MQRPCWIAWSFVCLALVPGATAWAEPAKPPSISTLDAPQWDCSEADPDLVHWRSQIGSDCGFPAIGMGRILIGTNNAHPRDKQITGECGVMMCFALDDGRFLWQQTHARLPDWHADLPQTAISCTPAIAGDRAFYMSNRGELVCVDLLGFSDAENDGPFTGERQDEHAADIVWMLDMVKELGVYKQVSTDVGSPLPSPLVVGDSVFAVTGNGTNYARVPAPGAPSFVAVDRVSGRLKWSSAAPGGDIIRGQWGSPALMQVAGRQFIVFPGGDSRLHGLDPATGKVVWRIDCVDPHEGFGPRSFSKQPMFWAAPTVVGNMLYIGTSLTWERGSSPRSKLLAIRVAERNGVPRPEIVWQLHGPRFGGTHCMAAVHDGVVYTQGVTGTVFALDAATGREIWNTDLDSQNDPAMYASPVVAGKLLLVSDPLFLFAFALGQQPKCLGWYDFGGARLMSNPLLHAGRLYYAAGDNLYCLRPPAEILKASAP